MIPVPLSEAKAKLSSLLDFVEDHDDAHHSPPIVAATGAATMNCSTVPTNVSGSIGFWMYPSNPAAARIPWFVSGLPSEISFRNRSHLSERAAGS